MVLTVYFVPPSAPCRAVLMTAKHLGIEVNTKYVDLKNGEQLKPEYLKINPTHTVPTIDDNGFFLWESRAIQTYLVNKYAPDSSLYPKEPEKRALVDRMLFFDMGTLYKAEGDFVYPQIFGKQPPDAAKEETFKKALTLFDEFLGKTTYAAGEQLTLADLSILASLTFIEVLMDYDFSAFPKVSAWLEKVKSELPYHKEINTDALLAAKEAFKSL